MVSTRQWWTFKEAFDYLCDYGGEEVVNEDATPANSAIRSLKRAIQDAHERIYRDHPWNHFSVLGHLDTSASYATGTVEYDQTGGANERQLTLTGGTWPAWAIYGEVLIGNIAYPVQTRVSDSILVLSEDFNPGMDVSSTGYSISRTVYPLPVDLLTISDVYNRTSMYEVPLMTENNAVSYRTTLAQPTFISAYSLTYDPMYPGRGAMRLINSPTYSQTLEFSYRRAAQQMKTLTYTTGTVALVSGSTTLTGTGTSWSDLYEGAIIRLRWADSNIPYTWDGEYPPQFEARVVSVNSSTSITVDVAPTVTQATCVYCISDPVDIHVPSMLGAFKRCLELCWSQFRMLKDIPLTEARYRSELSVAITVAVRHDASFSLPGGVRPGRYRVIGPDQGG